MIPGEYLFDGPEIEINAGRSTCLLEVNNTGDRPVQVGSHFHFYEVNRALLFEREKAYGTRLDIPAGTAVRFEPGEIKTVRLVPMVGLRQIYGGSALVMGQLDKDETRVKSQRLLETFLHGERTWPAPTEKKGKKSTARKGKKSRK